MTNQNLNLKLRNIDLPVVSLFMEVDNLKTTLFV